MLVLGVMKFSTSILP